MSPRRPTHPSLAPGRSAAGPVVPARRAALLVAGAALLAACGEGRRTPAPPGVEFVVAAGDSSYWVRTGAGVDGGVDMRRAPITLARVDGRFHELYLTDEDHSFHDAVFASQTVWRRDLLSGDSTIVFGDDLVPRLASGYAREHPDEVPLDAEEPGADEPTVSATLEVTIGDVVGPYLAVETFADLHPEREPEAHRLRRTVVDLRSGDVVTLAALVGDSVGRRIAESGRAAFRQARDSLLGVRKVARHAAAVAALERFTFDEHSFALTRVRRQPGVVFYVPGEGGDAEGYALSHAPIPLPAGPWWQEASAALSLTGTDEGPAPAAWKSPLGYVVYARPVPASEGDGVLLVLRDGRAREWPLGRLAVPASRIYWLDAPPISAAERRALARAFEEATFYDGDMRAVAGPARLRPAPLRLAANVAPAIASGRRALRTAHARP